MRQAFNDMMKDPALRRDILQGASSAWAFVRFRGDSKSE